MASTTGAAVDSARQLIDRRIAEIREESKRLERALRELGGPKAAKRRRPAEASGASRQPKTARAKKSKSPRAGRGERRQQLLAAVKAKPGSTGAELAKHIGISPNQIYGLISKAQADGAITKDGKGYRLA